METLEFANRSCSQDVSTLAHTCDQLTEELQSTRAQYESLERRYIQLNEEVSYIIHSSKSPTKSLANRDIPYIIAKAVDASLH